MSASEWDRLVWWEQRMLREGLAEEFRDRSDEGPAPDHGIHAMDGRQGEFSEVGITETYLT